MFGKLPDDPARFREQVIAGYQQHNQRVREPIPSERLLIYCVEEGWEPLCAFLNQPVPSAPFPHRNAGLGSERRGNHQPHQPQRCLPVLSN